MERTGEGLGRGVRGKGEEQVGGLRRGDGVHTSHLHQVQITHSLASFFVVKSSLNISGLFPCSRSNSWTPVLTAMLRRTCRSNSLIAGGWGGDRVWLDEEGVAK